MNILPLVFTLLLILSVLTIEKMDRFKNKVLVQKKYEQLINEQESSAFNIRQGRLYGVHPPSYRSLTFRPFISKKFRDEKPEKYKQVRQITIDLIHVLYGKAKFYKKMEQKRPEFVQELLGAIEAAAENMDEKSFKRIHDVARIDLNDPMLQEVFYRMLKGTIDKESSKRPENVEIMKSEKAYIPLLTYFNFDIKEVKIKLGLAPRELLLAIYDNPDIVQKLINLRNELTASLVSNKLQKDEATAKFQAEFEGKQKQGITDVLDYTISQTSKSKRE